MLSNPRSSLPLHHPHPNRWRRVAKTGLMLLSVIGLLGAIGYLLSTRSVSPAQATRTIQPVRTTIRRTILANGTILPRKEVIVKPQISGVIEALLVERGDPVQVGDLLAVIHPLPNPGNVNNADAALRHAQIEQLQAKREFDRMKALYRENFVSRAEFDHAQKDVELVEQQVSAARRQLEIVRTGASPALGRNASEVRATIVGTVLERPVETGAFVIETNTFNEGTTIVSIADMTDLIFRGKVDEPDAGSLRTDMPVTVVAGALPQERFDGRLESIAPKALEKDGVTTFEIRVSLTLKKDQLLRAGYSATAEVVTEERRDVLSLPERYVLFRDGKAYVTTETAPGKIGQREVMVGLSDGLTTELVSGVTEQDRIYIE